MKTMTKKNNRRTRRCNTKRRRSRAKGGMHRAAFRQGRHVLKSVFGESWPERIDKLNQMKDAALKGAADAAKKKKHRTPAYSAARNSFAFDSPHFRITETPAATTPPRVDEMYNTPKKTQTDAASEPILLPRLKHVENEHQRAHRLGLSVAPTLQHPNPIVAKLFHDDTI